MDCWQEVVAGGTALRVTGADPEGSLLAHWDLGNLMPVGNFQFPQELMGDFQSPQSFGLVWELKLEGQSDLVLSLELAASFEQAWLGSLEEKRRVLEVSKFEPPEGVPSLRSLEEGIVLEILKVEALAGVSAGTKLAGSAASALASAAQWGWVPC